MYSNQVGTGLQKTNTFSRIHFPGSDFGRLQVSYVTGRIFPGRQKRSAFQKIKNYQNRFSKKKLRLPKVGGFWKNPEILRFSYLESGSLDQKLSGPVKISRISKFFVQKQSLSFYVIGIRIGIRKLNTKLHAGFFLDFRFFDFFYDLGSIFDENH